MSGVYVSGIIRLSSDWDLNPIIEIILLLHYAVKVNGLEGCFYWERKAVSGEHVAFLKEGSFLKGL